FDCSSLMIHWIIVGTRITLVTPKRPTSSRNWSMRNPPSGMTVVMPLARLKLLMTMVTQADADGLYQTPSGEKPNEETENRMASTTPRWVRITPLGKPVVPDV